jgi:UDP-N-acetylmuramoyl-tripeptide--D-alanyl-D-alanine ligase
VIVNVGPVHLELLGSLEAIAAAKAELIAGLGPGAAVVVPVDESLLAKHLRTDVRTITFGEGGDVALENYRPGQGIADGGSFGEEGMGGGDADGEVVIRAGDRSEIAQRISLRPSFGQAHNLRNLLAAVAAARALGVTPEGRVDVRFSALRGERLALPGGVVLIDDCYNANPMSMRAAIDDLAETATARRVAVLGDMLELGPEERSFHREIGQHAAARGVDVLVTVGPLAVEMRAAFAGTPGADGSGVHSTLCEAHSVPDARAAAQLVGTLLREGDTVLVKGSRGVGLEHVGQALRARDPAHAPPETPAAPARARAGRR